jgi:hypothetical protein
MTDYIGKQVGLLQRMLSALGHGVSGLAFRAGATYGRPLFSVTYKHHSLAAMLPIPAVSLKNISRFSLRT